MTPSDVRDRWIIDRHRIHLHLWETRDRFDSVKIHQGELAEAIGVNRYHLSRVLARMVEQGRLKKISAARSNVGRYVIRDPYGQVYE